MRRVSEKEVVEAAIDFFSREGYLVRREVPNMGKSADLVAIKEKKVAIAEAKVSNWRRLLLQCKAHQTVADYIWAIYAAPRLPERLLIEADGEGYGVLFFNTKTAHLFVSKKPTLNCQVWPPQREAFSAALEGIEHE